MKKILLALFAGLMIFAFSACGSTSGNASSSDSESTVTEEDVTSNSDLKEDETTERYTSDGDLIEEENLPASDSNLSKDAQ